MTIEHESKIIENVLEGDTDAFEELLLANQKNVYNLALKLTGNCDDALDLSQEAFLKAFRLLATFRGDSRFSVWMYRITYNLCIDFIRKRKRTTTISLTQQDEDSENPQYEIPDIRELPEDSAIRREMRKIINESIKELDPIHYEIIVMREITDMTYAEIASALKISEGAVKSRLSRARANLIKILKRKELFPMSLRHKE